LIAIDWGTSNLRAFRLDEAGRITERRSSAGGILSVPEGRFTEALLAQVSDWLAAGEDRVLLSGMIGSRQGWVETRYLSCPAGLADLAGAVIRIPFDGADVRLIPGVMGVDDDGIPEVMRGEETEAMGMMDACGGEGLICLPGTHSKWIHLSNNTIGNVITCMTGEVYAALRKGTILGRTMTADVAVDSDAFLRGVTRAADSGGLLHHLFSVRTLVLTNQLKEEASASYLSGMLIGHEVRSMMPPSSHVHVGGAAPLRSLYAQAIEACGGSFTIEDEDAAARGLAAIGRRLMWT
jgi:2-dehydro-3-deoxygalactonokinase